MLKNQKITIDRTIEVQKQKSVFWKIFWSFIFISLTGLAVVGISFAISIKKNDDSKTGQHSYKMLAEVKTIYKGE